MPVWRPRDAEDRGGRGVERAMEECDEGPAPTARVSSGAAGVYLPQAGTLWVRKSGPGVGRSHTQAHR